MLHNDQLIQPTCFDARRYDKPVLDNREDLNEPKFTGRFTLQKFWSDFGHRLSAARNLVVRKATSQQATTESQINRAALEFLEAFPEFFVRADIALNQNGVADLASIHEHLKRALGALDGLLQLDAPPSQSEVILLASAVEKTRLLMQKIDPQQWAEGPWVDGISALFTDLVLYCAWWIGTGQEDEWSDVERHVARVTTDALTDWISVFDSDEGSCEFAQPFRIQLRRSVSARVNGKSLPALLHETPLVSDDGAIHKLAVEELVVALQKRTRHLCDANEPYGEVDHLGFFVTQTLCTFLNAAVPFYERVELSRLLELAESCLEPVAGAIGVDRTAPFPALCDLTKCFRLFPLQSNPQVRVELQPVLNRLRARLDLWRQQTHADEAFREKLSNALEILRPAIDGTSRSSRRVSVSDRLHYRPKAERFHDHKQPLLVPLKEVSDDGLFDETDEDIPCEVECISRFDWGIRIAVGSQHQGQSPQDEELLLRFGKMIEPLDDCVLALPYDDHTADGEQRWLVSKFTPAWSSSSPGNELVRIGGVLMPLLTSGESKVFGAFCRYLSKRLEGDFNRG